MIEVRVSTVTVMMLFYFVSRGIGLCSHVLTNSAHPKTKVLEASLSSLFTSRNPGQPLC